MATIFRFPKRPLINLRILNEQESEQQKLQNEMLGRQISQLNNVITEQENLQNYRSDMARIAEMPISEDKKAREGVLTLQQYFPKEAEAQKVQRLGMLLQSASIDAVKKAGDQDPKTINDWIEFGVGGDRLYNTIDKIHNDPRSSGGETAPQLYDRAQKYLNDLRNAVEADPNASPELKEAASSASWNNDQYRMLFKYDNQRMKSKGGSQFARYFKTTPSEGYTSPTDESKIDYNKLRQAQIYQEITQNYINQKYGTPGLRQEVLKYWANKDFRDSATDDAYNLIESLQPTLPKEYRGTSTRDLVKLYGDIENIRKKYPKFANALELYNAAESGDMETWINAYSSANIGARKTEIEQNPYYSNPNWNVLGNTVSTNYNAMTDDQLLELSFKSDNATVNDILMQRGYKWNYQTKSWVKQNNTNKTTSKPSSNPFKEFGGDLKK